MEQAERGGGGHGRRLFPPSREVIVSFAKFSAIGGVWFVLAVAANWLLIDVLGWAGWLGASLTFTALQITKYFAYLWAKVINDQLVKYAVTNVVLSLISVAMVSVAVDLLGLPAAQSTAVVVAFVFVFKYVAFQYVRLLRWEAPPAQSGR